jgi:hypothetical protein
MSAPKGNSLPYGALATVRWNTTSYTPNQVSQYYFSFEPNPEGDDEYVYPLSGKSDDQVFYVCDNGLPELLSLINPEDTISDCTVLSVDEIYYPKEG